MIPGRYILQPEVMQILDAQEPGAGGEIQLTDAMAKLIGNQPFHGFTSMGSVTTAATRGLADREPGAGSGARGHRSGGARVREEPARLMGFYVVEEGRGRKATAPFYSSPAGEGNQRSWWRGVAGCE